MFVWLASYPKSGNTLVRSMLASYFFSDDGKFNFNLLNNILQFPYVGLFKKIGVDIKNEKEVIKNYIKVQQYINKKSSIQFLKTHSYLFNIDKNPFTNLNLTLGVVYIVRDPRNVLLSAANHNQVTQEQMFETMFKSHILGSKNSNNLITYNGTWASNYNSWKSFKNINKYLLIKYEDLVSDKENTFIKILNFIHKLNGSNFVLNEKKFKNIIETTDFQKMQKLEEQTGFVESMVNKKTGKKVKFFNLGSENKWEKFLNQDLQKKIEESFKDEMIELGYL